MGSRLQILPAGIQYFEDIRLYNNIYVDKTQHLLNLIQSGRRFFLSRPRRFGKSLTISTLEAMFQGKFELFHGLVAEQWVKDKKNNPSFVLHLDLSLIGKFETEEELNELLVDYLDEIIEDKNLKVKHTNTPDTYLKKIIRSAYEQYGKIVILIDEYDKPILDNIVDEKKIAYIRSTLHSFYSILKACDKYIYFVFITGISRFAKIGIFSSINNLVDITFSSDYGSIVGYTQDELEHYFQDWIKITSEKLNIPISNLLLKMEEYYDGFCFDGETKLYNPFSILNFFSHKKIEELLVFIRLSIFYCAVDEKTQYSGSRTV